MGFDRTGLSVTKKMESAIEAHLRTIVKLSSELRSSCDSQRGRDRTSADDVLNRVQIDGIEIAVESIQNVLGTPDPDRYRDVLEDGTRPPRRFTREDVERMGTLRTHDERMQYLNGKNRDSIGE